MKFTNHIKTVNMDGMSDFERIDHNLRALIVSIEETIPGSRGFGLDIGVFDLMPMEARNAFSAELDEKVEQFMPEIRIADVSFDFGMDGTMSLEIYVERNDEYQEVESV